MIYKVFQITIKDNNFNDEIVNLLQSNGYILEAITTGGATVGYNVYVTNNITLN